MLIKNCLFRHLIHKFSLRVQPPILSYKLSLLPNHRGYFPFYYAIFNTINYLKNDLSLIRLQAMMATYGIQTQTPHEVNRIEREIERVWCNWSYLTLFRFFQPKVEPVQIWSSQQLIKFFQQLGVNEKIGLTGTPNIYNCLYFYSNFSLCVHFQLRSATTSCGFSWNE